MARVGRFGRMPRSAPDITGSIVSMLREFESMRERNIVEAWQEGGEFEGKRVTDQMLLDFWQNKADNFDKNDPLYDEARNNVEQYGFAVRNSKMELRYAQKGASDGTMAAFYTKEAGRHPKNSEAWREMMRTAASYRARGAAASLSGSGSRAAKTAEDHAAVDKPNRNELGWDTVMGAILDLARRRNILGDTGEDLGDLQAWQSDFGGMQGLIAEFSTDPMWENARNNLAEYIRAYGDPGFDGDFSMSGMEDLRTKKRDATQRRLDLALKQGTKTQINGLTKDLAQVTETGAALSVINEGAQYEEYKAVHTRIVSDPKSTPQDIKDATERLIGQLTPLYTEWNAQADRMIGPNGMPTDGGLTSVLVGRLYAELNYLGGDTTPRGAILGEEGRADISGVGSRDGQDNTDGARLAAITNQTNENLIRLANDPWSVLVRLTSDGVPSTNPDDFLGVRTIQELNAYGQQIAYVPSDPVNGLPVMQAVFGKPLVVAQPGVPDSTGRATEQLPPAAGTRADIGMVFEVDGVTLWMYYDDVGTPKWSRKSPIADGVTLTTAPDGTVIATLPTAGATGGRSGVETATDFDPRSALDTSFGDPNIATAMPSILFDSQTAALYAAKSKNLQPGMTDAQIAKMAVFEARGDQNLAMQLMAEVQTMQQGQQRAWTSRDDAFAGDKYAAEGEAERATAAELDRRSSSPFVDEAEYRRRGIAQVRAMGGDAMGLDGINRDKLKDPKEFGAWVKNVTGKAMRDVLVGPSSGMAPVVNAQTGFVRPPQTPGLPPAVNMQTGFKMPPPPKSMTPVLPPPPIYARTGEPPPPPPMPAPTINAQTGFSVPPPPKPVAKPPSTTRLA